MKKFIVIGAGGHGKVVADTIVSAGGIIEGFLDPSIKRNDEVLGHKVLGNDDYLEKLNPEEYYLANGIGTTPSKSNLGNKLRKKIFDKYTSKGFSFSVIIHPSAIVSKYSNIGSGSQIMMGAKIQTSVEIGKNIIVNTNASIDHDCTIGSDCHIAPSVTICGGVKIGDDCFIGAGAVIYPNRKIESGSIIPAGSIFK
jgi:UDP-perosamine 4-acetyltransferase